MGSSRLVSPDGSVGCLLVGFKKCLAKNKLEFTHGLSTWGDAAPCPPSPMLGCPDWGRGRYRHLESGGQGCLSIPCSAQDGPTTG